MTTRHPTVTDEGRRLLEGATDVPWSLARGGFGGLPLWVQAPEHVRYDDGSGPRIIHLGGHDESAEPDAALIVYAVNHLPAFLAAVEALDEMIDHDADQYDNCGDWGTNPCLIRERARAALAPFTEELEPQHPGYGWHNDGDECIGPDCINPAHFEEPTTPVEPEAPEPMRRRLARALHEAANLPEYNLSQRMMTVHGGPGDMSYLDAADMILDTAPMREFAAGRLAVEPDGLPLDVRRLTRALQRLVGVGEGFEARLDPGDYGPPERPYEFAARIAEAYARLGASEDQP